MKSLIFLAALIFGYLELTYCQTSGPLNCWVGYANNSIIHGGSLPCDGQCLYATGNYSGQAVNIFACEPNEECLANLQVPNMKISCCKDQDDCNAINSGMTMPSPQTPTPALPDPILCHEGLFYKNINLTPKQPSICYGECASVTLVTDSSANETFTLATCDPLSLCHDLDLVNSCHTMPQRVLSGCCCSDNLCIDPVKGIKPTPPQPPSDAIKCFIGVQIITNGTYSDPVGAESYCPGMCHSTSFVLGGTKNYTIYACDRYRLCQALGIQPNTCGTEAGRLNGCCCDSDNCNIPISFTPPAIDPWPPRQAERCFVGMALDYLGGNPIGRSAECFGDCVKYSAAGVTIYGCDPINVCEALGAKDTTIPDDGLNITCCSTKECTYQVPQNTLKNCYNGITINYQSPIRNFTSSKAQSLPCLGRCATYSTSFNHIDVDVYTCDPYNICGFTMDSNNLTVSCCDTDNCNQNSNIPVTQVNGTGKNITCFEGFSFRGGADFGNTINCDGSCTRVHVGRDTIYTCDPADTCKSFGLDGCHILGEGLSVCCCNGSLCNLPERRIAPALKSNLTCFIGYGVNGQPTGAPLPCTGMCGKVSTMVGSLNLDAYLCLDRVICEINDLYEQCGNLDMFDDNMHACCCGGWNNCNYNADVDVPVPDMTDHPITCPQGLFINGVNVYGAANTIVTCPFDCGAIHFNTTYNSKDYSFTYYGCDPSSLCTKYGLSNSCGALSPGTGIGACCCSSDLCMNPVGGKFIPDPDGTGVGSNFTCWVGYANNGVLHGGSIPCDGTCLYVNGSYSGQDVNLFACEPAGICNTSMTLSIPGIPLTAYCCDNAADCNVGTFTKPTPQTPTPSMAPPILCNEGIFVGNTSVGTASTKVCYGDCASVYATLGSTQFTVTTCDPLSLCHDLDLANSCHTFPQGVLSGCCCDSNVCIDPARGIKPMPPPPPRDSIKCFIGVQIITNGTYSDPVGAESYCPGMCHSTSFILGGTKNYTIYACDRYRMCQALGIKRNGCGNEAGTLSGCCCDSDNCNLPKNFTTVPTVDPWPPRQAERCFVGLALASLGGNPIGRSAECFGDCVKYSAAGVTIYGCDPINVCEALGAKDTTIYDDGLNITCCGTRECTYQVPQNTLKNCYNGITIHSAAHNFTYSKAQSLPCLGRCATYTTSFSHIDVDVYTCDPYNICNFTIASNNLTVSCCDSDNCNQNPNIPVTQVNGTGNNITCFEGFSFRGGADFGNTINCDGSCARVHIGRDTIYTCDPSDTCKAFGLDGCHILADGLSVCCCNGSMCNLPERRIAPALKPNLSCFIGYGINGQASGAPLPCTGMCGKVSTMVGSLNLDAYLCLDRAICEVNDLYEQCGNLDLSDDGLRACCCGGYDNCNYDHLETLPTSETSDNALTCPQGLFVNQQNIFGTGNIVVQCPYDCGAIHFNTTYQGSDVSFTYYGCDPSSLCTKFSFVNSCGSLGNDSSIGGCCCNTPMCMNPVGGVFEPGQLPGSPAPTYGSTQAVPATTPSGALMATLSFAVVLSFFVFFI